MHFADRILKACEAKKSRLVVGLDPHWNLIPQSFKAGYEPQKVADLLWDYFRQVVDASHDVAVMFKPQIAFFEQFGLPGLEALQRLIEHIHGLDGLVLMDAKRNDIGSTASAYARAFFGDGSQAGSFPSDGLTVNGYLGSDGLKPFLENPDHGVFILVKTSNPSSGELQDLKLEDGRSVSEAMADLVTQYAEGSLGDGGYGNAGAVIGATYPDHMRQLRQRLPRSLLLVPGYGAQGGDDAAITAAFDANGQGALINSSRGICFPKGWEKDGFDAVRQAAQSSRDHIQQLIRH